MSDSVEPLRRLLSAAAVRERGHEMLAIALDGGIEGWAVDLGGLYDAAELTATATREAYPDLAIPFHARWRHFVAGEPVLPEEWPERGRAAFDLVILSVLLDAGTGPGWSYEDAVSGQRFARSEGLAVASQRMIESGALPTDAASLADLDAETLAQGFQARPDNPLAGLEGRAALLRRLGEQALARAANISSIPTLMAFREGVLVFSQPGALPAPALDELIGAVRALDMTEVHAKVAEQAAGQASPEQ